MNRKLCASLLAGAAVLCTLILTGGDLRMFLDVRAAIVTFGGSFATTLIRFPLSSIFHGLPLGAKFAFSLRRMSQRDLVDELAGLAEVARKSGPIGLVHGGGITVDPLRCRGRQPAVPVDCRQAATQAGGRGNQPHADHRRDSDDS